MKEKIVVSLFIVVGGILVFSFDRWGEKAVMKILLSAFAPSKDFTRKTHQEDREDHQIPHHDDPLNPNREDPLHPNRGDHQIPYHDDPLNPNREDHQISHHDDPLNPNREDHQISHHDDPLNPNREDHQIPYHDDPLNPNQGDHQISHHDDPLNPNQDDHQTTHHEDPSNGSRSQLRYDFPDDFIFGVASSSYQVEGGWNEGGKTPSIWDDFVHKRPNTIIDGSSCDVGPNSYHNYHDDIAALKLVGFQHYRFSISWSRIIPNGSAVNQQGIDYYMKLIDELIANDIEPMITMFHWDLPKWLQNLGGLTNSLFVRYFEAYADALFKNFGSKVKMWMTMNEPFNFCIQGYGAGNWAPGIKSRGVGEYLCGHNLVVAHAAAYRLYRKKYFKKQRGKVGIVLDSRFYYPMNSSVTKNDTDRAQQYRLGWFAHPIYSKSGNYPEVMINEIGNRSVLEGRPFSRLPDMDRETRKMVKGSADFLGLNYYTSRILLVNSEKFNASDSPAWYKDSKNRIFVDNRWKRAKSEWLYSVPEGLRDLLNWIKDEYNNPKVLISENGWSDKGETDDSGRNTYFKSHMTEVSKAINEDGCNVLGYTAWSLLDSFEWDRGYTEKFGVFSVNFSSPGRERIPKQSAWFLKDVIKKRSV